MTLSPPQIQQTELLRHRIRSKQTVQSARRTEFSFLWYQQQLFQSERQILAFVGGTGSGKTFFAPRWLYWQMLMNPGHEWIISAPTIPMLKRNPIKYLMAFFRENGVQYGFNKTDMVFDLGGLGVIHAISAENADRMQGVHAKGIIGDEAGMYDRLWWDTALQRISFQAGRILLTTTPYAENWLKTEVYDRWIVGDDRIEWVNPRSVDNPFYPVVEYEEARRRLPEWKFKMLYDGQFTRPAGLIYPIYSLCEPLPLIPDDWLQVRGLDFGFNNPTAVLWLARDRLGVWYAYEEMRKAEMGLEEVAEELRIDAGLPVYADPSGKQMIATLRRHGLTVRPASNEVLAGISLVYELFKTGRLKVCRTLKYTIDELNGYSWEVDRKENILDRPKKVNDHLMDALRYALFSVEGPRRLGTAGGGAMVLRG